MFSEITAVIIKCNENIKLDNLQLGEFIKIPRNKVNLVKKSVFEEDEDYLYHKVKRRETLYSLSKKYNVSVEQIESANHEIMGIPKVGQFIKIPKIKNDTPETVLLSKDLFYFDSLDHDVGSVEFYETETVPCDTVYDESYQEPIDVALLLPLFLNENAKTFDIDSSEVDEEGETIIKYIVSEIINPHI